MISAVLAAALAAGPLGPCADVAQCKARLQPGAPGELLAALEQLALPVGDPGSVEPLRRIGGDKGFAIEALDAEREVRVRVSSLHRPAEAWGEATQKVAATGEKFKGRARVAAWRVATERAFEDLSARIAESLGQGVRKLKLAFRVNALEPAARAESEKALACLKSRLDLLGASTTPVIRGGYLEEDLEYAPAKGEPREPLEHHVAWVKAALLGGPKAPCTVVGTVLARYTVLVSADPLNKGVVVAFER